MSAIGHALVRVANGCIAGDVAIVNESIIHINKLLQCPGVEYLATMHA